MCEFSICSALNFGTPATLAVSLKYGRKPPPKLALTNEIPPKAVIGRRRVANDIQTRPGIR